MTVRKLASVLRRRHCAFAANQQGTSVVEFALLLPLMLTMYFGSIEVTDAISADRQVTLVAGTVADIAAQYQTVTATDVKRVANQYLTKQNRVVVIAIPETAPEPQLLEQTASQPKGDK